MLPSFKGELGMDKEQVKEKLDNIQEEYEKINERLKELEQHKLRLEGQYSAYSDMINEEEETIEVKDE